MLKNSFKKEFLFCTALGSGLAIPLSASAQESDGPPENQTIDENSVDLSRRRLLQTLASVSIGPFDETGLSYSWTTDSVRDSSQLAGKIVDVPDGSIKVVLLGSSHRFRLVGGVYTPMDTKGLSLSKVGSRWTFTGRDGLVAIIEPTAGTSSASLTSLQLPNGFKKSFYYSSDRLVSVATSTGYQLRFQYSASGSLAVPSHVIGFNMAYENCAPSAITCELSNTWPSASSEIFSSATGNRSNRYTDMSGKVTIAEYTKEGVTIKRPSGRQVMVKGLNSTSGDSTNPSVGTFTVNSVTKGGDVWGYTSSSGAGAPPVNLLRRPAASNTETYQFNGQTGVLEAIYYPLVSQEKRFDAYGERVWLRGYGGPTNEIIYSMRTRDERGNEMTSKVISMTPDLPDSITSASYSTSCANQKVCNKPNYTLDELGRRTDYMYSGEHGGVTSMKLPAAHVGQPRATILNTYGSLQATYLNGVGGVVSGSPMSVLTKTSYCRNLDNCAGTTDEVQILRSYAADQNLNLRSITRRDGSGSLQLTETFDYYPTGDLKTETGAIIGAKTRYYYDAARRLIGVIGPDPDGSGPLPHGASRTTYDADGFVIKEEGGIATSQGDTAMSSFVAMHGTEYFYDAAGRLEKKVTKGGNEILGVTQYTTTYISTGTEVCEAERMNSAIFANLPSSACVLSPVGSAGPDRITKTIYDAIGRVTKVTRAFGTAQAATETTAYIGLTKVEKTDANGNKTTWTKDGLLRPWRVQLPHPTVGAGVSSTTDYVQLAYDQASNVTSIRQRDGGVDVMTYDALNRLHTHKPYTEPTTTFTYDLVDNPKSSVRSDGMTLNYQYDGLGRLVSEIQPFGSVRYGYDSAGRLERYTYPDGMFVQYVYDAASRLISIRENGATSGAGVLATYYYDAAGRPKQISYGNGNVRNYEYGSHGRLTGLQNDLAGSSADLTIGRVGAIGSPLLYNPASQLTSISKSNSNYLENFRNTSVQYLTNGLNQYTSVAGNLVGYDGRGNLTSSNGTTFTYNRQNMLSSAHGISLAYDPVKRLVGYSGGTGNRFYYAGNKLIAELSSAGLLQRRYVYGLESEGPFLWYEGAGTTDRRYLHTDERGSVIAVANAAGSAIEINAYDSYGLPNAENTVRFGYTGQVWLKEIGLYHFKARMYSPTFGRFMQTDPLGYADGMNAYAYVGNDPINFVDPTGQNCAGIGYATCYVTPNGAVYRWTTIFVGDNPTSQWSFESWGVSAYGLSYLQNSINQPVIGQPAPTPSMNRPSPAGGPQNDKNLVDRATDGLCGILDRAPGDGVTLGVRLGGGLGLLYYGESYLRVSDAGRVSLTHSNSLGAGGGLIAGALVSPYSREPVEGIQDSTGTIFSVAALGAITNYARGRDFDFGSLGGVLGFGETRTRTKTYLNLDCNR